MKAASQLEVEDTTGKEWTEDDEDNMNSNIASTSPTNPEIFPEIFDYSFEDHDQDYLSYIEGFIAEIKRISEQPLSIFDQPSVLEKIKHNIK